MCRCGWKSRGSSGRRSKSKKSSPGHSVTRQFEVRTPNRRPTANRGLFAGRCGDARQRPLHGHRFSRPACQCLIIDGGLKVGHGPRRRRLLSAIGAGRSPAPVPTGLRPRVEAPRFLDDHPLDEFHAIYLCNVDRLPLDTVRKADELRRSRRRRGVFRRRSNAVRFSESVVCRRRRGLFPVPLEAPVPLLIDQLQKSPDLQITDHPIFRIFAGENNPFIKMVNIEKYFAVKKGWKPAEGSATAVIASRAKRRAAGDRQETGRRPRAWRFSPRPRRTGTTGPAIIPAT